MAEIWKDIPNFQGYQVSSFGRVRTYNKVTYSKLRGERHWKNKIMKHRGENYKTGYRVALWKDNKPYDFLVARLVAFTFYNEDINNHELTVNHIDGNRFNNNITNLELISLADNIRHAFATGLMPTNKKTTLKNVDTGAIYAFNSMSKASQFLGRCPQYVSNNTIKNRKITDVNGNKFILIKEGRI